MTLLVAAVTVHDAAWPDAACRSASKGITAGHDGLLSSVQMSQSTPSQKALTSFKHRERMSPVTNVPGQHTQGAEVMRSER